MASTLSSVQVAANQPPVVGYSAGGDITVRFEYSLAAALVVDDILYMGDLPAGHLPVDFMVDSDDLDTGGSPAIVLQAGILNAGKTDIDTTASGGAEWLGSSTVAQAGGMARMAGKAMSRVVVNDLVDRPIGIKISTAPATGATSGKVGLTLTYRPSVRNA